MADPEPRWGRIGPLGVRWLDWRLGDLRAGERSQALLIAENVGSATWEVGGNRGIWASYHWLDARGNPIVWGGIFSPLPHEVEPGGQAEIELFVQGPIPPGRYRLAVDLVAEGRCWFAEVGNTPIELECDVLPRLRSRVLAVRVAPGPPELADVTRAALAAQSEALSEDGEAAAIAHLAAGCAPAPDWARRVLDAHDEGYAAVGGSIEPVGSWRTRRRLRRELTAWSPGSGRNPSFAQPLLCPSVVAGTPTTWLPSVCGLPTLDPPEQRLFDGRIAVRLHVG